MEPNKESATARRAALRRAAHQLLDKPVVFADPIALRIIGKAAAADLRANPDRYETTRLSPYLRAFMAARSRCAEDELAEALQRGVRQYVILGAGLDTFAFRNPYAETLHVFEVDYPATQRWKLDICVKAGLTPQGKCTFVPVDFEAQTLAEALAAADYDRHIPTFFSWLGVTQYLRMEAVFSTLGFIASSPKGGGIVFDYTTPPSLHTPRQQRAFEALERQVYSLGEPWRTFFNPQELENELHTLGFSELINNGQEELNARYFKNRTDGLHVGSLSRVMNARI